MVIREKVSSSSYVLLIIMNDEGIFEDKAQEYPEGTRSRGVRFKTARKKEKE